MRKLQVSPTHSRLSGRNVRPFIMNVANVTDAAVSQLAKIGLPFDRQTVQSQVNYLFSQDEIRVGVMDSAFTAPATVPSIPTPIQFLQNWLPGFVKVLTTARKIDEIIGINTVGSWEDEEIVQGIVEPAGIATEYGDLTSIPLVSWNANFARRTIVRAEQGISVGLLEEGRSAKMRLNSAEVKRQHAAVSLEIFRNAVGFYGWNNGDSRTYGLLNDPELMPFLTNFSGKSWSDPAITDQDALWNNITNDLRAAFVQLRSQSGDNIDPESANLVLTLPTSKREFLSVTTKYGISVLAWLKDTYKKLRIVSAPELQGWNKDAGVAGASSDDCFYLHVEEVDSAVDGSTDDGSTFAQLVVTKFLTLGVEKRAKSYVEDYSAATAGTLCKRPWAVVRVMGI